MRRVSDEGDVKEVTVLVQLRVNKRHSKSTRTRERIGTRSAEGNKRSACADLKYE
jgi:hypothetical protein